MSKRMYGIIAVAIMYSLLLIFIVLMGSCGFNDGFFTTVKETPLQGVQGEAGKDGSNCTVANTVYGAVITCQDGTTANISNGIDGTAGENALVATIDLCGNSYRGGEVLLRLSDGNLYGVYAKGQKIYLMIVLDGDYESTDGFKCHFSVVNGQVIYPTEEEAQCSTN